MSDQTKMDRDVELQISTMGKEPVLMKNKSKAKPIATGEVEKIKGDPVGGDDSKKLNTAIIVGFFTPEINIREKIGSRVLIPSTKEEGTISGAFGKAGKCKVLFENGISETAVGTKAELFSMS